MPNWRLGMPAIWCEKNRCVKNKRPAQPALLGCAGLFDEGNHTYAQLAAGYAGHLVREKSLCQKQKAGTAGPTRLAQNISTTKQNLAIKVGLTEPKE